MSQLERDHAAEQAVYATFLDKFTQTSESVNLQEGDAQVISYADPPASPVAPDKKLAVALGGFAGIFGGLGLIFLRSLTDTRVRTTSRLHALIRGAHVIAQTRTRRILFSRANPLTVALREPTGPLSESVRSLRSHLVLSRTEELGQVVTFVSTRPNCGKTTTSLLLARAVVQMGISCVVVDADLRRASVATQLGLSSRPDLIDVLRATVTLEEALQNDPESKAQILTAQKDLNDPGGVLLTEAMSRLVMDLRKKFQMVIIDTAPLLPVSDAAPMVRTADTVVLMVRYGLPVHEVESGLEILRRLGVKKIATVLSMSPRTSTAADEYVY